MRHAESPSVGRLSDAMPPSTTWSRLIPPTSSPLTAPPLLSSTAITSETMPPVTAIADGEGRLTRLVVEAEKPDDDARLMSISVHAPTVTRHRFAAAGMMLTTHHPAAVQKPALSDDRGQPRVVSESSRPLPREGHGPIAGVTTPVAASWWLTLPWRPYDQRRRRHEKQ